MQSGELFSASVYLTERIVEKFDDLRASVLVRRPVVFETMAKISERRTLHIKFVAGTSVNLDPRFGYTRHVRPTPRTGRLASNNRRLPPGPGEV